MNAQKIAVVVDTGCDLPEQYKKRNDVFVLPFRIIYKEGEYMDGVDISASDVYARMPAEIPSTSLPTGQDIIEMFDRIRMEGFTSVLVVTISSKLSGTNNMVNLMTKSYQGLRFFVVDTKNIGIGSGFFAIDALQCIDRGMDFVTLCARMDAQIKRSKVFFSLQTLEYLQKGGRIGLVSSILGSALRIKPVISCNDEGVYYTVKKTRGRQQSLAQMVELLVDFAHKGNRFLVSSCYTTMSEDYQQVREALLNKLPPSHEGLIEICIGAALGIHTGPGLIGMGVYLLPEE